MRAQRSKNPLEELGLNPDLVRVVHRRGRLPEFVERYIRLAQQFIHPDHQGDNELSARFNAAHDCFKNGGDLDSLVESMVARKERNEDSFAASQTSAAEPASDISVEPIVLSNIVLYDAKGEPAMRYKKVTVSGESVKTDAKYVSKTQDGWTEYFAERRKKLISLPLLNAVVERLVEEMHPGLAGLAKDLKVAVWTSTRINYNEISVTHDYGTSFAKDMHCPLPYAEDWIENFKGKKAGRVALQALLMAKDLDKVEEIWEVVCGVKPYICTLALEARNRHFSRGTYVHAHPGKLYLNCNMTIDVPLAARWVVVE